MRNKASWAFNGGKLLPSPNQWHLKTFFPTWNHLAAGATSAIPGLID
jgi:hypothetical protein